MSSWNSSTRVPAHLKLRNGEGKYIVKKAVEDLLPADIVYRKKMGFPTPLRQWLLDPRADHIFQMLEAPDGLLAEYIDGGQLRTLIERQKTRKLDATDRIWRLLNLQVWGDLFLTGDRGRRWEEICRGSASARHEDSLGQHQFPAPHHQGRADPHARNAAAAPRAARDSLRGDRRSAASGRAARASEYSARAYPFRHRIAGKRSPRFALELAKGLFDPMPVAIRRFHSPALGHFLERLMAREHFDRRVVDFLSPTSVFPDLEHSLLFQHNVETIIWGRHAQLAKGFARRWYFPRSGQPDVRVRAAGLPKGGVYRGGFRTGAEPCEACSA